MKITIELHDLSEWAALAVVAQRVSGVVTMPEQSAKIPARTVCRVCVVVCQPVEAWSSEPVTIAMKI